MAALRVNVVKPIKPLRYRIAPIEEKVDAIEALEAEFKRAIKAGQIPQEEIEEYSTYLRVQREKIHAVKLKALGSKPGPEGEKDYDAMPFAPDPPKWRLIRYRMREYCNDKAFRWLLFLIVLFWLYCKNKS